MKERNASVDIFRLICAIMVVSIHTAPLSELGYNWSYMTVQILPRIGVPFFFCTMGYYYIGSLMKGQCKFLQTMKRLLITYGLWSVIYYIPDVKAVLEGSVSLSGFLMNCLRQFLIYGSREHFWFFPAVFFAVGATTLFARGGRLSWLAGVSIIAYVLGLLGCSYYGMGDRIPVISAIVNFSQYDFIRRILLMGFPFFMMGYFLQKTDLQKIDRKKCMTAEGILLAAFFAEIIFVNTVQIQKNVYITIFLYLLLFNTMLLLLKNPCEKYGKAASVTRDLANFIYYSHPLFIMIIHAGMNYCGGRDASGTELFLGTVVLAGSMGYFLHKVDNKYLNKLFK